MVNARSYVATHQQHQTPKQQAQTQMTEASDLQRRAAEIAAESMAALFAPKRVRLDVKHEAMANSEKGAAPSTVVVQESALKRLRGSESDAAEEEKQCGDADACSRRSSGSDRDLESDGASSSAPEQQRQTQSEQPARKARVRKPTYAVRKEEKSELQKQVQLLQAQVAFLKERAGVPVNPRLNKLGESLFRNEAIREALRQQHLSLANAQSAVHECLNAQQSNPMSSYIRLGTTWHDRRATLLALRDRKVRDAYEYVMARAQSLDPLKPHLIDDRFEDANGDFCCVRFEMIQFSGVQSVQQVFETLRSYLFNMEISISEKLGHVTTRDDYDLVDKSVSNHRLLSTEHGIEIELNGVMFTQFFEAHGPSHGNPCGVVAVDSVDVDELHPYAARGRVRKDISATCVITHHKRKKPGSDEDELVVVMMRGAFLRLHHADVVMPPQTLLEVRDGIARWGHAMLKCMHDMLYPGSQSVGDDL